jgi:hypothetical protein
VWRGEVVQLEEVVSASRTTGVLVSSIFLSFIDLEDCLILVLVGAAAAFRIDTVGLQQDSNAVGGLLV